MFKGDPAATLLGFVIRYIGWKHCDHAEAIALGSLATAEEGKKWLEVNGVKVQACKSDVLVNLKRNDVYCAVGISVKQCNAKKPTNAQLYFTTAHAFCELLRRNGIDVSSDGEVALRQFCGDVGYRPQDDEQLLANRKTDPRRFFGKKSQKPVARNLRESLPISKMRLLAYYFKRRILMIPSYLKSLSTKQRNSQTIHKNSPFTVLKI